MSGIIKIDMPKGVAEGSTTVSPQSPQGNQVASPKISPKGKIMIGYGLMLGKTVYNTAIQEIEESGNEELATALSNVGRGVSIVVMAAATSGLSLIPEAISGGSTVSTREKKNERQNRARTFEREMRGSRLNYTQGRGYE